MLSERRCLLRDKDKWAPFCGVRRAAGVMHGIYFYIVFEVQVIKERVWEHGGPHSSLALNFNSWLLIGLWRFGLSLSRYLSSGQRSVGFEKWLVLLMERATLITNREIMHVSVLQRINYSVGVINVAASECKSAIYFTGASASANKPTEREMKQRLLKRFSRNQMNLWIRRSCGLGVAVDASACPDGFISCLFVRFIVVQEVKARRKGDARLNRSNRTQWTGLNSCPLLQWIHPHVRNIHLLLMTGENWIIHLKYFWKD